MSDAGNTLTLIDSHTHLDQYDAAELPALLRRAADAGVRAVITAGVTIESSLQCVRLTERYPGTVWAGVGVHPMDLSGPLSEADIERLRALAAAPGVVCISEIGLDWMKGRVSRAAQEQAFRAQLRLAVELRLPVIFHNREAGMEPLRIIAEETGGAVPVVAHYFQGPEDYALACLEQGVRLSLAKPLLRLPDLQQIIADHVPLESIVLETDAFPQPYKKNRAKWTEPQDLPLVAQKVADLKGVSIAEVAAATTRAVEVILGRDIVEAAPPLSLESLE